MSDEFLQFQFQCARFCEFICKMAEDFWEWELWPTRKSKNRTVKVSAISGAQRRGTWGNHCSWGNSLFNPGTRASPNEA